jgi:hypothetical protein
MDRISKGRRFGGHLSVIARRGRLPLRTSGLLSVTRV